MAQQQENLLKDTFDFWSRQAKKMKDLFTSDTVNTPKIGPGGGQESEAATPTDVTKPEEKKKSERQKALEYALKNS